MSPIIAPAQTLAGRREAQLLAFPSVERMADTLASRCRDPSWVRSTTASVARFRASTGHDDLEALLVQSYDDVNEAELALREFAKALDRFTDDQVAALGMGPKIWFRLNGVAVSWRPLAAAGSSRPLAVAEEHAVDRLTLLALIGSGLHLAELLRLKVGDAGSLGPDGTIVPDIEADPLAVSFEDRRGKRSERLTFVSYHARAALLAHLERRRALGQPTDVGAPLIAGRDGSAATVGEVAYARRRNRDLIRASNAVNVALCRATGDFFRGWGLPGSRFAERVR